MFWYLMTTVLRMFAKISENIREHSDVMASLNGLGRIWHTCTGSRADPTLSAPGPGPLPGLGSPLTPSRAPVNLGLSWKEARGHRFQQMQGRIPFKKWFDKRSL